MKNERDLKQIEVCERKRQEINRRWNKINNLRLSNKNQGV